MFETISIPKHRHALVAACALALMPTSARAGRAISAGGGNQTGTAAMALPSMKKALGLRSGDFTLTPAIELAAHHDTNVFNGNTQDFGGANAPVGGTSMRIFPGLGLTNGSSSNVQFNFASKGDIRIYMSDNPALSNLTNFGGSADLDVTFAARRAISFTAFDHFLRALQADNWETINTLNRIQNNIGGRVSFHPGEIPERRPLEVSFMGAWAKDNFEKFDAGDTSTIRTRLTGSWRFLPKTAIIMDASWDFRYYDTPNALAITSDSRPWRANAGLAGAVTKHLTARLTGGYGMSLHDRGPTFSGALWGIGFGYRASATTLLNLSYTHDFYDAYLGNYVDYHRGSADINQRFGTMLDVSLYGIVTYGVYGELNGGNLPPGTTINAAQRVDVSLDAGVKAHFEVSRMLGAAISWRLRSVFTNFQVRAKADNTLLDVGSYIANELLASVTLRY